jgi:hypothetical protein
MSGSVFSGTNSNLNLSTEDNTEIQAGSFEQIQQRVYGFFLEIVRRYAPEQVIYQFRCLFIDYSEIDDSLAFAALGKIIFFDREQEFRNTLVRCCYILINNWRLTSNYHYTRLLIGLFSDPSIQEPTRITKLKTLRTWLKNFVASSDYESLLLFLGKSTYRAKNNWSDRFTSYLLTSQYADLSKPVEQRQIADALSRKIKKQFKFDLAMYTARLGRKSAVSGGTNLQSTIGKPQENPTSLGDGVLNLVKTILTKQGETSYKNLATQFLQTLKGVTFLEFKQMLVVYLELPNANTHISQFFEVNFIDPLTQFHSSCDRQDVMPVLVNAVCKRVIQLLTLDEEKYPSVLFDFLLSQDNPMPLAILLLKVVLLRRDSRLYLETCIANLIKFHSQYPEDECRHFVNFLDILNITLAIYEEDTDYNIVRMSSSCETTQGEAKPDDYRVFSFTKRAGTSPPDQPKNTR